MHVENLTDNHAVRVSFSLYVIVRLCFRVTCKCDRRTVAHTVSVDDDQRRPRALNAFLSSGSDKAFFDGHIGWEAVGVKRTSSEERVASEFSLDMKIW